MVDHALAGRIARTIATNVREHIFTSEAADAPNPSDPTELTDEQAARAIQFFFRPTQGFIGAARAHAAPCALHADVILTGRARGATLADAERKGLGTIDVRNGSGCEDALDPQTRLLCSRLVREKNATPSQHSNLHHLEEWNWKAMGRKGPRRVAPGTTGPTGETWGTPACTPLPASMTAIPLGPRANAHDTCLWPCDERQIPTSCTPSRYA